MTYPNAPNDTDDSTSGVQVMIVDDHGLLSQSLAFALQVEGVRVERCDDITAEGITQDVEAARPALVLLDLDIGGELGSSVTLIPSLRELGSNVVMLTGVSDPVRLAQCVHAGAVGLIPKSDPFESLVDRISSTLTSGTLLTAAEREEHLAVLRRHQASERERLELFEQLTPREAQVLAALMAGMTAEQIASEWVVAMSTVRSQIRNLLVKLGVNSQLSAVVLAQKAGWTGSDGTEP